MTTDEAQLVSAVSMLKALGVEEESDIEVDMPSLGPGNKCHKSAERQRTNLQQMPRFGKVLSMPRLGTILSLVLTPTLAPFTRGP